MQLTDIGNKGKAVGRFNERVVFVTGGVPGDVVDVQVTKAPHYPRVSLGVHTYSPAA